MLRFLKNLFFKKKGGDTNVIQSNNIKEQSREDFEDRPLYLQRLIDNPEKLEKVKFIYCLVGNAIRARDRNSAEDNDQRLKHFSAGTKLYCFPPQWSDGYEKVKVMGLHKKSRKMTVVVVNSKNITNWRLKTVYEPFIIRSMLSNNGWTNLESDKVLIDKLAKSLNSRS